MINHRWCVLREGDRSIAEPAAWGKIAVGGGLKPVKMQLQCNWNDAAATFISAKIDLQKNLKLLELSKRLEYVCIIGAHQNIFGMS